MKLWQPESKLISREYCQFTFIFLCKYRQLFILHDNYRPMKPVLLKHSDKLFLVNVALFPDLVWYETEILAFYLFKLFHLPTFLVCTTSHQLRILKTFIHVIEPKISSESRFITFYNYSLPYIQEVSWHSSGIEKP